MRIRFVCSLPLVTLSACAFAGDTNEEGASGGYESYSPGTSQSPAAPPSNTTNTTGHAESAPACSHSLARAPELPSSASALELLNMGDVGYCPGDGVALVFLSPDNDEDVVVVPAVSAAPLKFVVPAWLNSATARWRGDDLIVGLADAQNTYLLSESFDIRELVVRPDAADLGDTTRIMLSSLREVVAESRAQLAEAPADGRRFDRGMERSERGLELLETATLRLQETGEVLRVSLVDGGELVLDRNALAVMDAFFEAFLSQLRSVEAARGAPGALRQAQMASFDDADWFRYMARAIGNGTLGMAEQFAGSLGNALAVLGVAGALTGTAAGAAGVAGVAFVAMMMAPPASALAIDLGTRLLQGDIEGQVWSSIEPSVRYLFEGLAADGFAEGLVARIEPSSEVGAALVGLLDGLADGTDGLGAGLGDWVWSLGAHDDSVPPPDPDDLPDYIDFQTPYDPGSPSAPSAPAGPGLCNSTPGCSNGATLEFCLDSATQSCWYAVGGRRVMCGSCTDPGLLYECAQSAGQLCAG